MLSACCCCPARAGCGRRSPGAPERRLRVLGTCRGEDEYGGEECGDHDPPGEPTPKLCPGRLWKGYGNRTDQSSHLEQHSQKEHARYVNDLPRIVAQPAFQRHELGQQDQKWRPDQEQQKNRQPDKPGVAQATEANRVRMQPIPVMVCVWRRLETQPGSSEDPRDRRKHELAPRTPEPVVELDVFARLQFLVEA